MFCLNRESDIVGQDGHIYRGRGGGRADKLPTLHAGGKVLSMSAKKKKKKHTSIDAINFILMCRVTLLYVFLSDRKNMRRRLKSLVSVANLVLKGRESLLVNKSQLSQGREVWRY